MKRVLISAALVLAFITLVFTQTVPIAQTAQRAQTDRQLINSRPASDTTAADEVDALLAPWSQGNTPGARSIVTELVLAQTYNRVSEKTVKPIKGKKLVLTGVVRDGDEVLYRFRARAGQRVTARVSGRDADFTVYLNYGLDVEAVARDTKSWSLTMPREFNGHCEIALHSTYKLADYRLEILLK
jgi:hypothetical protein